MSATNPAGCQPVVWMARSYRGAHPSAARAAPSDAMSIAEIVRALFTLNRQQRVKLALEQVERLHDALGGPLHGIPTIHVAGTNGKGSVCWKTHAALCAGGVRSALFVSPHVSSFRERIRIRDVLITEEEVVRLVARVEEATKRVGEAPSFFEIATMVAALHAREGGAEAIVLETGLGGRLDATNVVRSPVVTAITSIGWDHMQILGGTLDSIAVEKAGILKPGVPVVLGPTAQRRVVLDRARELQAPVYNVASAMRGARARPTRQPSAVQTPSPRAPPSPPPPRLRRGEFGGCRRGASISPRSPRGTPGRAGGAHRPRAPPAAAVPV